MCASKPEGAQVIAKYNRRRRKGKDLATFDRIDNAVLKTRRNGYAFRSMRSHRGLAGSPCRFSTAGSGPSHRSALPQAHNA
jgi:hypothetical protein